MIHDESSEDEAMSGKGHPRRECEVRLSAARLSLEIGDCECMCHKKQMYVRLTEDMA